jgi:hypothetical protein
MIGKILLSSGILGSLIGGGVLLVSLLLPAMTNGRTSWEEAMLGIIPGAFFLIVSFLIAVAGVVVILIGRKGRQAS